MLKQFRIMLWLYLLLMVAVGGWLSRARTTDWDQPLNVVIYHINGDDTEVSQSYIAALDDEDFEAIENFFSSEAERYQLQLKEPVDIRLGGHLSNRPPLPPVNANTLSIMLWSLKLRYWAWKHDDYPYPEDVKVFVQYFDPAKTPTVAHSLGLQKGLIGVVNAFAREDMKQENNIVIAHELLHTVGAIDKYDLRNNLPLYPVGYAEPDKQPLFPQNKAEVMAGRIALGQNQVEQPRSLDKVVIGGATAREINWVH